MYARGGQRPEEVLRVRDGDRVVMPCHTQEDADPQNVTQLQCEELFGCEPRLLHDCPQRALGNGAGVTRNGHAAA